MKIGISSMLFANVPLKDAVRAVADLGADCMEVVYDIPHFPPDHDENKLTDLKELLNSHGLGASVHSSFWELNAASHYPELQELTFRQITRSIDACRTLGGDVTVVHFGKCPMPDVIGSMDGTKRRYLDLIRRCVPYARDRGVTIALENRGNQPEAYPRTIAELKDIVSGLDGIKVAFDIGHAHLSEYMDGGKGTGERIAGFVRELREYIAHIHIHDNHGKSDDHLPVGDGDIDFPPIVEAIREINFDGMIVAELWSPKSPMEAAKRGMDGLRKILGPSRTLRRR